MLVHTLLSVLVTVSVNHHGAGGYYINPDLPADDLYRPGDILLGALSPIYEIVPGKFCSPSKINNYRLQTVSAMIYTIEKINADPSILPNLTLGYVVVNDCERESVAVAKSTKFVSGDLGTCPVRGRDAGSSSDVTGRVVTSSSVVTGQALIGSSAVYKVAGFISPPSSAMSVPVSSLISLYQIPHMSWTASSQELSDKARFAYFSRVIPPDQYQSRVMMSIVRHFNWTYISTLHSEGSYGSNGISAVQRIAKQNDICIAYSKELKFDETDEDFDNLVVQLRKNRKAKVIVMFIASQHVTAFLGAIGRNGATGEFVLIGGDGYSPDRRLFPYALNTFSITWSIEGRSPGFEDFYLAQNPWWNASGNPWLGEFRDVDVGCSWSVPEGETGSCHQYKEMRDVPGFTLTEWYTLMMDAIQVFGQGLHNLISDRCPSAFTDKTLLDTCITGPLYQQYLMGVKFDGVSGWIEFDENGDALGNYKIMHYYETAGGGYDMRQVGRWTRRGELLTLQEDAIQWHEQIISISDASDDTEVALVVADQFPESVCAKPCAVGEFYIMGELKCCWECRHCRTNERLREDSQGCVTCPENTWPDQTNFTTCEPVPPIYLHWLDPITLGLVALTAVGLLTTMAITWIFIKHRDRKVIKGSNRELMAPVIFGLFLAYISVFFYITKPELWACFGSYFGFNTSCTLIFGPLFLKCCRLYRIFDAAEKCKTNLKLVSSVSMVVFMLAILIVQVSTHFDYRKALMVRIPGDQVKRGFIHSK